MRVTIFTAFDTALNPYILLFKEALEGAGKKVSFGRDFNLKWLLSNGKSCDVVHLHWIGLSYSPAKKNARYQIVTKLIENRFVKVFLDVVRLLDFSLTFFLSKLSGKIIVFTVHDLFQFGKQSLRKKMQLEIVRHIVFRYSNSIHAHNHHTRKLIEKHYKRKTGVFVIPHGNYIGYYTNKISRSKARQLIGIPNNTFVFLFLGLLRPYKGLEDLFEAFRKLEYPEARLLVVGRVFGVDGYESKLIDLSRTDSRIKLIPKFVPDEELQIYLNGCDIFVLPYKDITTSGAAALALSFGRPIIAPAITSFPEVVTPESGILYDASKPGGLVSALKEARTRPWSESVIFDYAHTLDWDKLGPQLAALYAPKAHKRKSFHEIRLMGTKPP